MLAPQMETYDKFGHEWKPYLMFMQKANFKSNIINTDNFGLRYSVFGKGEKSKYTLIEKSNKIQEEHAIIGGSAAFGVGSTSDQSTISSNLSKMNNIHVHNLGVRAFSGYQSLMLFQILKDHFLNLKYLIIMSGVNDIFLPNYVNFTDNNFNPFFYQDLFYKNMNQPQNSILKKILYNFLPNNIKKNIDWSWDDKSKIVKKILSSKKNQEKYNLKNEIFDYKKSIKQVMNTWKIFSTNLNFKIIYVLDPNEKWCSHERSDEEIKIFDEIEKTYNKKAKTALSKITKEKYLEYKDFLKNECNKNGFEFLDLNQSFSSSELNKKWIFLDPVHCTDLGYKVIADNLNKLIK
tara:strand:+ start:54268 stop:55311 length:1044 start_codon:yes stop_codon:yes gene_type:complete